MGLIGTLSGGILINRLHLRTTGMSRLVVICGFIFLVGLACMVFIACPKVELAGESDPLTDQ